MKSLEAFYKSELLPDLEKLEARRLTVKKKFMQAVLLAAVLDLAVLFVVGKIGLNLIILLMALVLTTICTLLPWYNKYFKSYKEGFKDTIIPKIVAFIDQGLHYDKTGMVAMEEFVASHLFNDRPADYHGDDLVAGSLGQTAIRFSEIHAKRLDTSTKGSGSKTSTNKKYTPIFNGLFFIADFNKSFKGTTIVLPDTAQKLFGEIGQALQKMNVQNGQLIKMEDPEFEKLFVVYGQDQVEARYILSTSLMRRIVKFQNRARKKMRISFSANKLYIAISFGRALFEPRLMESLLDISQIQEYYDDLKLVIDIVEELNLNTRIWTPKGPRGPSAVATANAASAIQIQKSQIPPAVPIPGEENQKRSAEKTVITKEVLDDFISKADTTMAPKVKTAKRWLKRIAGIILGLHGLMFFVFELYIAGWVLLGIGLFFLVGGFMNPGMEKLVGSVLFIVLGVGIAFFNYNAYKTGVESGDWPTSDGMIIKSEIKEQTVTTEKDGKKTTRVKSYPKIAYQYRIQGHDYESTRISFAKSSGRANQIVSRYPMGKTVRVYYNPDKPEQAVLVPGNASLNIVPFFFAGVSIFMGVGIALSQRKKTAVLGN